MKQMCVLLDWCQFILKSKVISDGSLFYVCAIWSPWCWQFEIPEETECEPRIPHLVLWVKLFPVSIPFPGQRIHQQSQRGLCVWTRPRCLQTLFPGHPKWGQSNKNKFQFLPLWYMLNSHPQLFTQMESWFFIEEGVKLPSRLYPSFTLSALSKNLSARPGVLLPHFSPPTSLPALLPAHFILRWRPKAEMCVPGTSLHYG